MTAFTTSEASARVGLRATTIEPSICVATTAHLPRCAARSRILLLQDRDAIERQLHAQVAGATITPSAASRIRVERLQRLGSLELGHHRQLARADALARVFQIRYERTNEIATMPTSAPAM